MSPLLPNALANSGQVLDPPGVTASLGGGSTFNTVYASAVNPNPPAQFVSRQMAFAQTVSGLEQKAVSPSPADALKPKLNYAGNSLAALNTRVAAIAPTSAAQSLQNRLDLLNVKFRAIGDAFQNSAAKNDPMQLLRLQNDIYQLDEELELVSRVVDQATSGVRSLLQTQI